MANPDAEPDVDTRPHEELMRRWDMHTDRQLAAAKGGITAVTILNSGSWLALLSQADKLASLEPSMGVGQAFLAWGLGALFGTLPWLFLYLNSNYLGLNDLDREKERQSEFGLTATRFLGLASILVSLSCFGWGVIALSSAL